VHEGPQSITPFRDTGAALEPGNILSNEPGYYVEDEYGFRIENLILVVEAWNGSRNGPPFLGFETITLCPIDTRLVDRKLMEPDEVRWLNEYHKRVYRELSPHLVASDRNWLKRACASI
jgi:Xaa-Pro aminopeptidase